MWEGTGPQRMAMLHQVGATLSGAEALGDSGNLGEWEVDCLKLMTTPWGY